MLQEFDVAEHDPAPVAGEGTVTFFFYGKKVVMPLQKTTGS